MTERTNRGLDAVQTVRRRWGRLLFGLYFLKAAGILALLGGAALLATRLAGGVPAPGAWAAGCGSALAGGMLYAAVRARRALPRRSQLLALLDEFNHTGGLLLLADARPAAAADWQEQIPTLELPRLRADFRRPTITLLAGILFTLAVAAVPLHRTATNAIGTLDIANETAALETRLEVLETAEAAPPDELAQIRDELRRLAERNRADDPARSYALLEALAQKTDALADRAADGATGELRNLRRLEQLSEKLQDLSGLPPELRPRLAPELDALLRELARQSPSLESLAAAQSMQLDTLSASELARLNRALAGLSAAQLAKLRQLAPAQRRRLSQCATCAAPQGLGDCAACRAAAGTAGRDGDLAAFLDANAPDAAALAALCTMPGNGGVDRGRGDAPLELSGRVADNGAQRRDLELPSASDPASSEVQGRFAAAPEGDDEAAAGEAGRLAGNGGRAAAGEHAAIWPEHRQTVRRFFTESQP